MVINYTNAHKVCMQLSENHSPANYPLSFIPHYSNTMATIAQRQGRRPLGELSPAISNQLVGLRRDGWSYGQIGQEVGLCRSTVQKTCEKETRRHNQESLPRTGRPTVLSPRLKRLITRTYKQNPKMTYAKLIEETCPGTHRNTLLKFMKTTNIHKWRCLKRTLLTQADANNRLA